MGGGWDGEDKGRGMGGRGKGEEMKWEREIGGLENRKFTFSLTRVHQRIASVGYPFLFSTDSDDDGGGKKKTRISSLLSSLKQTGTKVSLEDVLQSKKPVEQSQADSTASQEDASSKYTNVAETAPDDRGVQVESPPHRPPTRTPDHASDTIAMPIANIFNAKADSKQPVSAEMNDQLKSILSKLKVDTGKSQLSRDIVGAVKGWGRMNPRSQKDLENDFKMQSQPEPARFLEAISLTSGARLELFDDIFKNNASAKEAVSKLKFLEGEDMAMLERQKSLDQRNDFLTLIDIADKQWKFPVDNEVCKVEEENVGFEEHVFLGYLLDGFPKKGPVRRFMELVVHGLEQNPYMSVEQKRNQVSWFKGYFDNVPEKDLSF
ncbi:hypothetical protein QZH41_003942 [Actinostola sp. cb2023]|nr:hypothetical protein QZH41_003942 [Actinostola sp. cb2023]